MSGAPNRNRRGLTRAQRIQDWRESAKDIEARAIEIFKTAIGWALFSLKTAILINGAAAIAVLAFLGSLISSGKETYVLHIAPCLFSLSLGVLMAAIAGGAAYLGDLLGFTTFMNPGSDTTLSSATGFRQSARSANGLWWGWHGLRSWRGRCRSFYSARA